jgi:hypothetical protein
LVKYRKKCFLCYNKKSKKARKGEYGMEKVDKITMIRAKSSARKFGGVFSDYLPIHQWFDETKDWLPDERYMVFRHHAQGIFEAEEKFGYTITNSKGKKVPTRVLCEMHITEDLGFIPTAQEWLNQLDMQKWMGFRDKNVIFSLRKENENQNTVKELITDQNIPKK